MSYVTQQRTREFGIRMALGATRRHIVGNVFQQGGLLVAVGIMAGVVLSLIATRVLSELLFETAAVDPVVFASAVLLLAVVGLLACLLPGVRAAQLEPRAALNTE